MSEHGTLANVIALRRQSYFFALLLLLLVFELVLFVQRLQYCMHTLDPASGMPEDRVRNRAFWEEEETARRGGSLLFLSVFCGP